MPTAAAATEPSQPAATAIHRIEVRPRRGHHDPRGASVERAIASLGLARAPKRVEHAAVYLLQGDLTAAEVDRIAN